MSEGGHELVVDVPRRTCACRKWQLTGIPCFHACACIFFQQQDPTMYVHECYTKDMYMKVYSHLVEPINGEEFWTPTNLPPPLPPTVKVAPGRPKKKRSRKTDVIATENDPTKLKRQHTSLKCGYCKEWGHNNRTCPAKKRDKAQGGTSGSQAHVENSEGSGSAIPSSEVPQSFTQTAANRPKRTARKRTTTSTPTPTATPTSTPTPTATATQSTSSARTPTTGCSSSQGSQATHGGIFRPFIPPAKKYVGGIEQAQFTWKGKPCTTLQQLQAAHRAARKGK